MPSLFMASQTLGLARWSVTRQVQLRFDGIMKESDGVDHVIVGDMIEHDIERAFDRPMGVFGLLAGVVR